MTTSLRLMLPARDWHGGARDSGVPSRQSPRSEIDLSEAGRQLDTPTRDYFTQQYRHDFTDVRVHTSPAAAASAAHLGAAAYTFGEDVVFARNRYQPTSRAGLRLLAHELAHVVQQRGHTETGQSDPREAMAGSRSLENAADVAAARAVAGSAPAPLGRAPALAIQMQRASGLEMWQERVDPDIEAQRLEAFNIIRSHRSHIVAEAARFKVAPEAIAGAILWEALENPYHRSIMRLGPGKVHPTERFGLSEAQKVEAEGRVRTPADDDERDRTLHQAAGAITYIAAIMRRHADNYLHIAKVDISTNVGVLCTLYQGGNSEVRAGRLKEKRKTDPNAQPQMGDEMGPWVERNIDTIRGWVQPPPRPG
jgi:hypothetical protein